MINDRKTEQQSQGFPGLGSPMPKQEPPTLNPFAALMSPVEKTFADIVVNAFNNEYLRVAIADAFGDQKAEIRKEERIQFWAIGLYTSTNFSTFFTDASIRKITEDIFSHEELSHFVLNFVERVFMMTQTQGSKKLQEYLFNVAEAVIHSKPTPDSRVIPQQVSASIKLEENLVRGLITDNVFLFAIYVLLMNFDRVCFFEVLMQAKEKVMQTRAQNKQS